MLQLAHPAIQGQLPAPPKSLNRNGKRPLRYGVRALWLSAPGVPGRHRVLRALTTFRDPAYIC